MNIKELIQTNGVTAYVSQIRLFANEAMECQSDKAIYE